MNYAFPNTTKRITFNDTYRCQENKVQEPNASV